MAGQAHSVQEWTGLRSCVRDDAKRPRTPNFPVPMVVPVWSFLVCEVGGRWSGECQNFLSQLAKAKVRHEPPAIRASAHFAWLRRWSSILACCASRSFCRCWNTEEVLVLMAIPSSSEVVADCRYCAWCHLRESYFYIHRLQKKESFKESKFWAHQWEHLNMRKISWRTSPANMICCSCRFPRCRTQ